MKKSRPEAFWERVDKSGDCWMWTGATNTRYPVFALGGRGNMGYAHRFSFELNVGPIPDGYEIDHLCRVPLCVRPDHLEAVTPQENKRRTRTAQCQRGHERIAENVWIGPRGEHRCIPCDRLRWQTYQRPPRGHRHRRPELASECPQCRGAAVA